MTLLFHVNASTSSWDASFRAMNSMTNDLLIIVLIILDSLMKSIATRLSVFSQANAYNISMSLEPHTTSIGNDSMR